MNTVSHKAQTTQSSSLSIDLLRHGQVATPGLFCAPPDEPLGVTGWKQLNHATAKGQWDAILASPSRRCHDFARQLAQRLDTPFIVEERFREMDFGEWVGQTQWALWEQYPEEMQQLWYQPLMFAAPGGELMKEFINRVQAAWATLLQDYTGQHVLVLTHAGVIRVLLAEVLGILYKKTLRFEIAYAQISRIQQNAAGNCSLLAHGLTQA